jgi:short-subunit dehydrogenase
MEARKAVSPGSTVLIVGGSSGLGRDLAERFASSGYTLALLSSDPRDTGAVAADLSLRWGVRVLPIVLDLAAAPVPVARLDEALDQLPPLTGLVLAAGAVQPADMPGQEDSALEALTSANYTALCRIVNHCLPRLQGAAGGLVVGFGSIAAARGRTRNAGYSAAKRALQSYFESLRHALAGSDVVVQFYVLGYLDTNLAFGRATPLPAASPARLADRVYRRRRRDFGVAYYPRFWRPICALLRGLPWFMFRRLSF